VLLVLSKESPLPVQPGEAEVEQGPPASEAGR
jgi:hypothetical protein